MPQPLKEFEPKKEVKEVLELKIDPKYIERLKIIADIVGGDFDMKVELGKAGGGTCFSPEERKIIFDPLEILKNPTQAEFIAAHEGGHRAITRGFHEIGLKKEKIEELSSQLGLAYGQNFLEDPADNNWLTRKYPGFRKKKKEFTMRCLRRKMFL